MLRWAVATLMPFFSIQLSASVRLLWSLLNATSPGDLSAARAGTLQDFPSSPCQISMNEASQCDSKVWSSILTGSVQDSSWNGNFSILTPIVSIFSPDLERPSFLGLSCDSDSLLTEKRLPTVPNHSWLEVGESLKNNTLRQTRWV